MPPSLRSVLTLTLISAILVACEPFVKKTAAPVPDESESVVDQSSLNFRNVYDRVLSPRCLECHGIGESVKFETYAEVKSNLARIYQSTVIERRMPKRPQPPLTNYERGLLNAWISAGAPE